MAIGIKPLGRGGRKRVQKQNIVKPWYLRGVRPWFLTDHEAIGQNMIR